VPLRPDIVIINPSLLDLKRRNDYDEMTQRLPGASFAALVYQYVEPDTLRYFNVTIEISDSREKIAVKLRQLMEAEESVVESTELSEREKEILVAVAKGLTNKSIAEQYHLSIHTVITHRKNLTRKTGIKSVSGLTVYAILNNLIDIKEVE
jgi:DNA-binding CsgD family transcriptional regulator